MVERILLHLVETLKNFPIKISENKTFILKLNLFLD